MSLPLYILRRYVAPGGVRLPKSQVPIAGICPACKTAVVMRKAYNVQSKDLIADGIWFKSEVYHYSCQPGIGRSCLPAHYEAAPANLRGNLGEEEYRYWIGSTYPGSNFAMCRACRKSTYGASERAAHLKDSDCAVGGDRCTTRLIQVYTALDSLKTCLICKMQRHGRGKWGIPLCAKEDCLNRWKFDQDKWIPIEMRLRLQLKKAGLVVKDDNPLPIVAIGPPRDYCTLCRLFKDNESHAEIHAAYLNGSGFKNLLA